MNEYSGREITDGLNNIAKSIEKLAATQPCKHSWKDPVTINRISSIWKQVCSHCNKTRVLSYTKS